MVNNSEKFKDDHNKQNRISSKNALESYFFKKLILDNCDEAIKSAKAACPEPKVVNPLGLNPPSMRLTKCISTISRIICSIKYFYMKIVLNSIYSCFFLCLVKI